MLLNDRERATIDMVARVVPRLMATLSQLQQEALDLTGLSLAEWRALSFEQREEALRAARRSGAACRPDSRSSRRRRPSRRRS